MVTTSNDALTAVGKKDKGVSPTPEQVCGVHQQWPCILLLTESEDK